MILIVSYDLKTCRDYTGFYETLQQQGPWWHYLASTWLINTANSPETLANAVRPYMDPQDSLLVAEMGIRFQGFLPKQAWDWIYQQQGSRYVFDTPPAFTGFVPGKPGAWNPQSSLNNPFFADPNKKR